MGEYFRQNFPLACAFLIPGMLCMFSIYRNARSFFEQLIFSLGISLAYWIVGFSFLKYIPVSFTDFITYSLLSLVVAGIFAVQTYRVYVVKPRLADIVAILVTVVAFGMFWRLYWQQIAPAGADMATHTYTARVILEADRFPSSHYPLVPINTFGFGPYGFSVVTAIVSVILHAPTYRSALLMTALSYSMLFAVFFLFLRRYRSILASLVTLVIIFVYERHILLYVMWGGNTTLLALALALLGSLLWIDRFRAASWSDALIIAVLFAGSYYTHPTPTLVCLLISGVVFCFHVLRKKWSYVLMSLRIFVIVGIFLAPYAGSSVNVSEQVIRHIYSWHTDTTYFHVSENILMFIPTVIRNLILWYSHTFVILTAIGVLCSGSDHPFEHYRIYLFGMISMFMLVGASLFLIYPVSLVFYPDRVMTIMAVPAMYFISGIIDRVVHMVRVGREHVGSVRWAGVAIVITVSVVSFLTQYSGQSIWFFQDSQKNSSVRMEDLFAFTWVRKFTPMNAIFDGNYGDAGIWLPSVAGRMSRTNDVNAQYIDAHRNGRLSLVPDYIFIGSVSVYHRAGDIVYLSGELERRGYDAVYSAGSAMVFRVPDDGSEIFRL